MEKSFYIASLISKKIKGELSEKEDQELMLWANENPDNLKTYQNTLDRQKQLDKLAGYNSFNADKAWNRLENELFKPKTIQLFSRTFLKYAAAFIFPLVLAGGAGYYYFNQPTETHFAQIDETVKPGVQKATLILSDGGTLTLDQNTALPISIEDGIEINNADNLLSYASTEVKTTFKKATYNKLVTPRGGNYSLKLADGSTVWLNAGSSIKFPVAFTDSTRHVFLEGEAYFEVAHNGLPFIVSSGEMDIRVMGTSFNVSAYTNDTELQTTLVEGSVRVDFLNPKSQETESEMLVPNMQATIDLNSGEIKTTTVDASLYNNWVDGKFEFNNEPLDNVMKKLARWYDFEYVFENEKIKVYHFSGRLDNTENISTLLKMLEMTTSVEFKFIENKIVIQ